MFAFLLALAASTWQDLEVSSDLWVREQDPLSPGFSFSLEKNDISGHYPLLLFLTDASSPVTIGAESLTTGGPLPKLSASYRTGNSLPLTLASPIHLFPSDHAHGFRVWAQGQGRASFTGFSFEGCSHVFVSNYPDDHFIVTREAGSGGDISLHELGQSDRVCFFNPFFGDDVTVSIEARFRVTGAGGVKVCTSRGCAAERRLGFDDRIIVIRNRTRGAPQYYAFSKAGVRDFELLDIWVQGGRVSDTKIGRMHMKLGEKEKGLRGPRARPAHLPRMLDGATDAFTPLLLIRRRTGMILQIGIFTWLMTNWF
jgi:hypothetical protein